MKLFATLAATLLLGHSLPTFAAAASADLPAYDKTEQAARRVVERYYAELERGHYRAAYQLWRGNGSASGKSLHDFTAGFADTAHTSVAANAPTDAEGAAGSVYVTVPVRVTAVRKDGMHQQYVGKYVLRRCNDVDGCTLEERRWHIDSAALHPAP